MLRNRSDSVSLPRCRLWTAAIRRSAACTTSACARRSLVWVQGSRHGLDGERLARPSDPFSGYRGRQPTSERVGGGFASHGDPARLGERLDIGLRTTDAAEAGGAEATEGDVGLVVHGLVVDVDDAGGNL